jgi:hypothetical protein
MRRLWAWLRTRARAYDEWMASLPPEVQAEIARNQGRHL